MIKDEHILKMQYRKLTVTKKKWAVTGFSGRWQFPVFSQQSLVKYCRGRLKTGKMFSKLCFLDIMMQNITFNT
jgi:hypothetical protein